MQPVDTNWPGFQPLGCGSICTQGIPPQGARSAPWGPRFALGWYRSAPLALEGGGSICTQGFAPGWYRSAPLALEAIRRVWVFGERHNLGFSQTDPLSHFLLSR